MKNTEIITLRTLFVELVDEFTGRQQEFIKTMNFSIQHAIRVGNISAPGTLRNASSYSILTGVLVDKPYMLQKIHYCVHSLQAAPKIQEFVIKKNLWHCPDVLVANQISSPSLMSGLVAGFICRNFEITGDLFKITKLSFDQAFQELLDFFGKDDVEVSYYLNLKGLQGDQEVIIFNPRVSMVKASYDLAKRFSIYYTTPNHFSNIAMFEGEYVLKIVLNIPKKEYDFRNGGKASKIEQKELAKWRTLPVLGCPGYLKIEKQICQSPDWPIVFYEAMGPYGNETLYPFNLDNPKISDGDVTFLQKTAAIIIDVDYEKLDKKISYALERLIKAKEAIDLNSRVVELAMALEYLINTIPVDVSLQLKLKTIKLIYDNNEDESIYKVLSDFYNLRSKIVHGNAKMENIPTNKLIMDSAEKIIQQAIVRYIELNKTYAAKKINDALHTSLHIAKTVEDILKDAVK